MPRKIGTLSPPPSKSEVKAEQTTRETRAIAASENEARGEKTARLKAQRLAKEGSSAKPQHAPALPRKRKAGPRVQPGKAED